MIDPHLCATARSNGESGEGEKEAQRVCLYCVSEESRKKATTTYLIVQNSVKGGSGC